MDNKTKLPSLTANAIAALATVVVLGTLGYLAVSIGASRSLWAGYVQPTEGAVNVLAWIRWILGDMTEAQFYKQELAAIGMLLGAVLAYGAWRRGDGWQGFAIAYGSGLLPWMLFSATLGLILSNLLWGWTIIKTGLWQPTFVPFFSLPAATVLVFGRGKRIALSGAIAGALFVTPASLFIVNYICSPFALPSVIGNVGGMAIGSTFAFTIFHLAPDLVKSEYSNKERASDPPAPKYQPYGVCWTFRRILADFTEAPFYGNELASIGLLAGLYIATALNAESPVYGSGLLAEIVTSQALASAIGVVVWRHQWVDQGWYPTFIPVVSVTPAAVLAFGGTPLVIILSAILGALIGPPLGVAISGRLPKYVHPFVGNVTSMAFTTLIVVLVFKVLPWI